MQKQQVSFTGRIIRLITSGLYLVVASVLISLFPIKKLKLITPLKPLNIKHSKRNYCVSTQEITRRVRTISKSNNYLESTIWLDRDEYENELIDICHLEHFHNSYFPNYYDFSYECQTKAYWDCDNEERRLIAKDQYNQLVFDYEEKTKFLAEDLEALKLKAISRSYSCLCYWPYDQYKKESFFTDEEIQKAKFCFQQQINASNITSKNYL